MTILRQFISAPSLARLIQKERGGERVLEGYFPDQPQRRTYAQVKETRSSLILEAREGAAAEEDTNLPPTHAQALLAVSQGQVEYLRATLSIGSHEIQALHFVRPVALDLVAVASAPVEAGPASAAVVWTRSSVSNPPTSAAAWLWMALRTLQRWMRRTRLSTACSIFSRTGSQPGQFRGKPRSRGHPRLMFLAPQMLLCPRRKPRRIRRSTISAMRTRSFASWRGLCSRGGAKRS
jgi:hypothetical protein